jgi:ABC-2 type transport system permease protein
VTILRTQLKRIFRGKLQLFFIVLLPLFFMSFAFIEQEYTTIVAVIDKDQTRLTALLKQSLASKAKMLSVSEAEMEEKLAEMKLDYVLVIEKGFTDALIRGEGGKVKGVSIAESNLSEPVHAYLEQWLRHASTLARGAGHQAGTFYTALERYAGEPRIGVKSVQLSDEGASTTLRVMGFMVLAMMCTSVFTALKIVQDKNNHTLIRTMMAPVPLRSYMAQTIASFLLVSLVQITVVLLLLRYGLRLYMGESVFHFFVLMAVFSLVSVSLGILVSSFSRNIVQAALFGFCVIPPLGMLGGAYFPLDWAPEIIKILSQFDPVTWMMQGAERLLHDQPLAAIGREISVLLLFAAVFFLLGTVRKTDIAK